MHIHIYSIAAVFLLAAFCLVPASAAVGDTQAYAPDRVIIKYVPSDNLNISEVLIADFPAEIISNFSNLVPGLQVLKLPTGVSVESAIDYLSRIPGVEYVEPDYYVSLSDAPAVKDLTQNENETAVPSKSPVPVFAVIVGALATAVLIRRC